MRRHCGVPSWSEGCGGSASLSFVLKASSTGGALCLGVEEGLPLIEAPFWHPAGASAFLLDWDGVLAETSLDFGPIRDRYFGGRRIPLLEAAETLPEAERRAFYRDVEALELEGARRASLIPGADELLRWLCEGEIPWAVVSRNFSGAVEEAASRVGIALPQVTLTRDQGPVKPDPKALWEAAKKLGADPSDCVFVGDFLYDLIGARRAGMRAVLVQRVEPSWLDWVDVAYPALTDLVDSLLEPEPLVPWEYRDLVNERGRRWLERAWPLSIALAASDPSPGQHALEVAALGVGRLVVSPEARLSPVQWRAFPFCDRVWMGESLAMTLRHLLNQRYPLVSVVEGEVPEEGDDGGFPMERALR